MRIPLRAALPGLLLLSPALTPAAWGADAPAATHYVLDPSKSTLEFNFSQAGAQNKGKFKQLAASFDFAPDNLAASRLDVTIEVGSLDTGDQERDDTLRSADLFAVSKFKQARFSATQIAKTATGYEAIGKLTIRDVTREARVPFALRTAAENGASVVYMTGKTSVRRLDYGVGQGDWKATDQVGNDVGVTFTLRYAPR